MLVEIFIDALVEIFIAVTGDIIDDLQDGEGLFRQLFWFIAEMQELDLGLKQLLDVDDWL